MLRRARMLTSRRGLRNILIAVLATLPVHWRHFLKKRIFAALDALPASQRRGDGSEVRRAFDLAVAEFPQLAQAQAQAAE